jgi:hypothetical protein
MPRPFPFLVTLDDARALATKERDNFYPVAFLLRSWLALLVMDSMAEYAEKKNAAGRCLQTGQAWRSFQKIFAGLDDPAFVCLFSALCRLASYEDPMADILSQALDMVSLEHESSGDYFGVKTPIPPPVQNSSPHQPVDAEQFLPLPFPATAGGEDRGEGSVCSSGFRRPERAGESGRPLPAPAHPPSEPAEIAALSQLLRRSVERLCDWIDAEIHLGTHRYWHNAPACFDPDPDKRELAVLGDTQRQFISQTASTQALWHHVHNELAHYLGASPKWPAVGRAMASAQPRPWPYREVDTTAISLWPLLKRHNWTYRDLMNVVRSVVSRSNAYPCQREQDFTVHCRTVLGLRKTTRGKSTKTGRPLGYDIALRLFPPQPPQPQPWRGGR